MAIYHLPPSPFVGGRQPLAPKDLNPSFEDVPPPPVDDPPSRRLGVFAAIFIAWSPINAPIQLQRFTPVVAEPVVEAQVSYTRHLEIYNSWISEQIFNQQRTFTPQVAEVVPSEFVPYTSKIPIIISNWGENLQFIQTQSKVVQVASEVFVSYLRPPLQISLIDYAIPQLQHKLAQEGPPPVADNPPFGQRIWLNQVISSWIPLPFDFTYPIQIIQEGVIAPVDDPPFGRRVLWLNTVLDAWIPPPPPPWNPIVHITPPTSDDIIIWMWKRVF